MHPPSKSGQQGSCDLFGLRTLLPVLSPAFLLCSRNSPASGCAKLTLASVQRTDHDGSRRRALLVQQRAYFLYLCVQPLFLEKQTFESSFEEIRVIKIFGGSVHKMRLPHLPDLIRVLNLSSPFL